MSDQETSNGVGDAATIDPAAIDTSAVDPEEFAKNISKASDDDLKAAMSSPLRPTILNEIFSRMEEHFRAEAAGDVDAVIHWRIGGGPNDSENRYEVIVRNGSPRYTDQAGRGAAGHLQDGRRRRSSSWSPATPPGRCCS